MQRFFICWSKLLHICLQYKQIHLSIEKDHKNNEFVEKKRFKVRHQRSVYIWQVMTSYLENNDDDDQL